MEKMSDAFVARLVTAVDRQSKDPGSNPGTIGSVSFSQKDFKFLNFYIKILKIHLDTIFS